MKKLTATERQIQKVLNLVNKHEESIGKAKTEIDVRTVAKEAIELGNDSERAFYTADAVLQFIEKPARFTKKKCKWDVCTEVFFTNYRAVSFCSNHCRARYLRTQIGIEWDPTKTEQERWGGEPPLVIPPHVVKKLLPFAQAILDAASLINQADPELLLPNQEEPDFPEEVNASKRKEVQDGTIPLEQLEKLKIDAKKMADYVFGF